MSSRRKLYDVQQCGQYLALASVEARDVEEFDVLSSGLLVTSSEHTPGGAVWLQGRYLPKGSATVADTDTRIYPPDARIRILTRI